LGIFSFHPRKSITTGEGGAIVTNDADLAQRCRTWRNHGQQTVGIQRDFVLPGLNYRMTEIQAAIGRVQLSKFESILNKRRIFVQQYLQGLQSCPGLQLPANHPQHTWQTLMVRLARDTDRARIIQQLALEGIESGPGSVAGHLAAHFQPQPALPVSESLHHRGLALPLHAGLEPSQVDLVIEAVQRQLDCSKSPPDPTQPSRTANRVS